MAYSEAIEVYKNVLERDENFPAHFFTFGTQKQKITEIIRYLLLDKLNMTSYEEEDFYEEFYRRMEAFARDNSMNTE